MVAGQGGQIAAGPFLRRRFGRFLGVYTWAVVHAYLPDITIGYDFANSDRLKELSYHEFAHAIQYRQGGHDYWLDLVQAEIEAATDEEGNGGHGNQFSENADFISLIESWAHHLGHTYADRSYAPLSASNRNITWLEILESDVNESPNHIPEGLYHDLFDVNTNMVDQNLGINDNVLGFTNQQMFSCFTSDIRSIEAFQTCLANNHLADSGNTIVDFNALFNSY